MKLNKMLTLSTLCIKILYAQTDSKKLFLIRKNDDLIGTWWLSHILLILLMNICIKEKKNFLQSGKFKDSEKCSL